MNDDLKMRLRSKTLNMTVGHAAMEEAADCIDQLENKVQKLRQSRAEVYQRLDETEDDIEQLNRKLIQSEALVKELRDVLKAMCEEFRGHDLPYGSKAYLAANQLLSKYKE